MTRLLDRGNRDLIDATLDRLELLTDTSYLDVGFGGGAALQRARGIVTAAPLHGTDFSPDVIRHGRRRFAALIRAGRLRLSQADITRMPFDDGSFDRISTTNTIYFWPDAPRAASELARLLAPGGRVAVGYTGAEKMAKYPLLSEGFVHFSPPEVEALLRDAGLSSVRTDALSGKVGDGDFVTVGDSQGGSERSD